MNRDRLGLVRDMSHLVPPRKASGNRDRPGHTPLGVSRCPAHDATLSVITSMGDYPNTPATALRIGAQSSNSHSNATIAQRYLFHGLIRSRAAARPSGVDDITETMTTRPTSIRSSIAPCRSPQHVWVNFAPAIPPCNGSLPATGRRGGRGTPESRSTQKNSIRVRTI